MMTTTHRPLLLALVLLCLPLLSLAQPAWQDWRNGVPKALDVKTLPDGLEATVIGTHRWDTDVTHPLV